MAKNQAYVEQSGTVTPGHYATWSASGVIQDGGPVPPTPAIGPYTEQSGEVTPGHLAVWTYDGVIEDGGAVPAGLLGWLFRIGPISGATNVIALNLGTTTIFCDTRTQACGVQLPVPDPSPLNPRIVNIVDLYGKAASHNITVTVTGGSEITGNPSLLINFNYESVSLADSGSVWSPI